MAKSSNLSNYLLKIGEIAKMMGVSSKSLRYYEQLGLLKPAYIDFKTQYRYYKLDQLYLIEIIQICVEIDIPLKNLKKYISNDVIDFSSLLQFGKKIIKTKLKTLNRGLRFIENVQQKIESVEKFPISWNYQRKIETKYCYVVPCKTINEIDMADLVKGFTDVENLSDNSAFSEFGYILEKTEYGIERYIYLEAPYGAKGKNIKIIPSGMYQCSTNEISQIENLVTTKTKNSFIALETTIFTSKYKINKPLQELKILEFK